MLVEAICAALRGGVFLGLCVLVWSKSRAWFQKKCFEKSPDDDATPKEKMENGLPVRNLSREILNGFPHSIALQKKILLNLRIVEYKLAELEQFLVTKGLHGDLTIPGLQVKSFMGTSNTNKINQ